MNRRNIITRYVEAFNREDEENQIQAIDNAHALAFLEENIPLFICPDEAIQATYYFRWWTYRKHIKNTPNGQVITEFHPDVPWAGAYNTINCAASHHIMEGRWLRHGKGILDHYLRFWIQGEGNAYAYSSWLIHTALEYAKATGDEELPLSLLDDFTAYYEEWERRHMTAYGLFWSLDDRDGMEYQISGSGLRPTINSYMYGNARTLSILARKAGREALANTYAHKAEVLAERIHTYLWDKKDGFYKTIPMDTPDGTDTTLVFAQIDPSRNVREEIGYIPWEFGLDLPGQETAWAALGNSEVFHAPFGPRTADAGHPGYRATPSQHECLWDGPSWPFATTQTANALIAHLQRNGKGASKEDFMELMACYTRSHSLTHEDGRKVPWIDENLDAETGEWISRRILKDSGWESQRGGYERGKDYNHSTYCDLVIRGIVGIIPCEKGTLRIDPLLPENTWTHFLLADLPYQGHLVDVCWDAQGTVHNKGSGLSIWVDGNLAIRRDSLGKLKIEL